MHIEHDMNIENRSEQNVVGKEHVECIEVYCWKGRTVASRTPVGGKALTIMVVWRMRLWEVHDCGRLQCGNG